MDCHEQNLEVLKKLRLKIEDRLNKNKSSAIEERKHYERGKADGEYETLLWVWALLEDLSIGNKSKDA